MHRENALNFRTLVVCLPKRHRQTGKYPDQTASEEADLVMVFSVCFSDKHFVNYSPENQLYLITESEKCSKF